MPDTALGATARVAHLGGLGQYQKWQEEMDLRKKQLADRMKIVKMQLDAAREAGERAEETTERRTFLAEQTQIRAEERALEQQSQRFEAEFPQGQELGPTQEAINIAMETSGEPASQEVLKAAGVPYTPYGPGDLESGDQRIIEGLQHDKRMVRRAVRGGQLSSGEAESAVRAIDRQMEDAQGAAIAKKRSPYPEGRGIGDVWTEPISGIDVTFVRDKDGIPRVPQGLKLPTPPSQADLAKIEEVRIEKERKQLDDAVEAARKRAERIVNVAKSLVGMNETLGMEEALTEAERRIDEAEVEPRKQAELAKIEREWAAIPPEALQRGYESLEPYRRAAQEPAPTPSAQRIQAVGEELRGGPAPVVAPPITPPSQRVEGPIELDKTQWVSTMNVEARGNKGSLETMYDSFQENGLDLRNNVEAWNGLSLTQKRAVARYLSQAGALPTGGRKAIAER